MSEFVLDASVAMAWHFFDEQRSETDALLDRAGEGVLVPSHWPLEVANSLLVGERRGRTHLDIVARFIDRLSLLPIEIDALDERAAFNRILPLARAHDLTVYDGLYLELAERRGLPLATLDADLAAAARSIGLVVLGGSA